MSLYYAAQNCHIVFRRCVGVSCFVPAFGLHGRGWVVGSTRVGPLMSPPHGGLLFTRLALNSMISDQIRCTGSWISLWVYEERQGCGRW